MKVQPQTTWRPLSRLKFLKLDSDFFVCEVYKVSVEFV